MGKQHASARRPRRGRAMLAREYRAIVRQKDELSAALGRYAARMEGLHEIDGAILSARSHEAIALAALGHIRRLVPPVRASVAIFHQPDQQARILAVSAGDTTYLIPTWHIPMQHFGEIANLQRGQPYCVNDLTALADPSETIRR